MAYELESEKDKLMKKTEKPMGAARKFIDNTLKAPDENSYDPYKHNGSFKFKVSDCKHAKLKAGK